MNNIKKILKHTITFIFICPVKKKENNNKRRIYEIII